MKRSNKKSSTAMNDQNKTVRAVGFNHKKYSTNKVNKKYSKPNPTKKMVPRNNSLV